MPVVPSRQLQVGLSGASAARVTTPQMKDATHEQNQQMGQAMQQFGVDIGKITLDIQQEANSIRVQDAVNKATVEALDLTYGESGYMRLKGEGVMNRPDGKPMGVAYTEELEKRFTGIEDTLGNDAQRRAFRQWSGQYRGQFNTGLYKYEAEQAVAYGESVLRGTIAAQEQVLQHNWDKPEMLAASFGSMSAAFVKLKLMGGMPAGEVEAAHQGFVSGLHGYVVTQALQNANPDYALAYVQQYGSQMTAQDFESAQKTVNAEMDMRITGDVVNGIFAANPDASEQEMMALLSQTPEIAEHPSRIALARDDVMAKKQAQAQAQAALLENGGNWMALPLAVRNAIPPEMKAGVQAYARSVAKPVQVTNAQAYLALTDPDALAEMSDADFEMARTKLAKGDFEYFARQRKVVKGGAGVVPSTPDVLNALAVNEQVDGVMKMLKIDPRPEQSRPDQNKEYEVARNSVIRQKINKYVLSHQMAEGKNYTPAEIQTKVGEFIAEQVQGRSSVSGAKGAVKRDIFTAPPWGMSKGVKSLLKYELAREGVENPTEGDIFQRYLQKEKFDKQEREAAEFVHFARAADGRHLADVAGNAVTAFGGNPMMTSTSGGKGLYSANYGEQVGGLAAGLGGGRRRYSTVDTSQVGDAFYDENEEEWIIISDIPLYKNPELGERQAGGVVVRVMINRGGETHAGMMIGEGKNALLFDPGGSYTRCSLSKCSLDEYDKEREKRGSGDCLTANNFNWGQYLAYHRGDGPYVEVYEFVVSTEQAELMRKDITDNGGADSGWCAARITEVLKRSGGVFSDLDDNPLFFGIRRPATLGKQLYEALFP